jgi:hypothetical protein
MDVKIIPEREVLNFITLDQSLSQFINNDNWSAMKFVPLLSHKLGAIGIYGIHKNNSLKAGYKFNCHAVQWQTFFKNMHLEYQEIKQKNYRDYRKSRRCIIMTWLLDQYLYNNNKFNNPICGIYYNGFWQCHPGTTREAISYLFETDKKLIEVLAFKPHSYESGLFQPIHRFKTPEEIEEWVKQSCPHKDNTPGLPIFQGRFYESDIGTNLDVIFTNHTDRVDDMEREYYWNLCTEYYRYKKINIHSDCFIINHTVSTTFKDFFNQSSTPDVEVTIGSDKNALDLQHIELFDLWRTLIVLPILDRNIHAADLMSRFPHIEINTK